MAATMTTPIIPGFRSVPFTGVIYVMAEAARLNEDQRDNPANGAYWDPVVWKETPETCR